MVEEAEVLAATGPGLEAGIEPFAETERAVVEGVATGSAVVAVEIALAKPHPHPVGHQGNQPRAKQAGQLQHLVAEGQARIDLGPVVALNQVGHDQAQLVQRLRMGLAAHAAVKQL